MQNFSIIDHYSFNNIIILIEEVKPFILNIFENLLFNEPNKIFLLIIIVFIISKIQSIFYNKNIAILLNKRHFLIVSKNIYKKEFASLSAKYNSLIVDQNKKRKFDIIKKIENAKKEKQILEKNYFDKQNKA